MSTDQQSFYGDLSPDRGAKTIVNNQHHHHHHHNHMPASFITSSNRQLPLVNQNGNGGVSRVPPMTAQCTIAEAQTLTNLPPPLPLPNLSTLYNPIINGTTTYNTHPSMMPYGAIRGSAYNQVPPPFTIRHNPYSNPVTNAPPSGLINERDIFEPPTEMERIWAELRLLRAKNEKYEAERRRRKQAKKEKKRRRRERARAKNNETSDKSE